MYLVDFLATALAVCVTLPVLVLFAQCVVAVFCKSGSERSVSVPASVTRDIAYLVPAHNEEQNLAFTLTDIQRDMETGNRLVVVADNCSDRTAEVASRFGAEVLVRHDDILRGKGYALAHGIEHLRKHPPAVVIFLDADCRIERGFGPALADEALSKNRPVQARDIMVAHPDGSGVQAVAEFAWLVKNVVSPLGRQGLGMAGLLAGTGMAVPWEQLSRVDAATGSLAEDLKLGVDLAIAGNYPAYLPSATLTSRFPVSEESLSVQRQRWEVGSLAVLINYVVPLLKEALRKLDVKLFLLAIDISIPPLVMYFVVLVSTCAITGVAILLGGSWTGFMIALSGVLLWSVSVFMSWAAFGRKVLPLSAWPSIFRFILQKKSIYAVAFYRKKLKWQRTDRRS